MFYHEVQIYINNRHNIKHTNNNHNIFDVIIVIDLTAMWFIN